MRRWVPITILIATALVVLVGLVSYFAYGYRDRAPGRAAISGLSADVQIDWHQNDFATIHAESDLDFAAGLGYAHAMRRGWNLALWRQVATGRLSEWFGERALPLDATSRQLGLARMAMRTYEELPESERALLDAYARGVNAALLRQRTRTREFAALNVVPLSWESWHALAIERLYAWLSASPPAIDSLASPSPEVRAFLTGDRQLRAFLHTASFSHSAAWTIRDSAQVVLAQRLVTGASALPMYLEVRHQRADSLLFSGLSLPGTMAFPAGRASSSAWSILPGTTTRLERSPVNPSHVDTLYDRVVLRDGDERLLRTPRLGSAIVLGTPPPPPPTPQPDTVAAGDAATLPNAIPTPTDSLWLMTWRGQETRSDLGAWMALLRGQNPTFELLEGEGLVLDATGDVAVIGSPPVLRSHSAGVFVSRAPAAAFAAARLDSLHAADDHIDAPPMPYLTDCISVWAATLEPRLVDAVDTTYSHARFMDEALTYLRNWDFSYDRTSIAASIFDGWMAAHRDSTGRLPRPTEVDTSRTARHRLYASLVDAINRLANQYGTDMSQWRWEVTAPHTYHFPVWSADTLSGVQGNSLVDTRYAPIEVAGAGHPTTLCWGPSPILGETAQPGHWEWWISTASWDAPQVRRRHLKGEAFLARYRISDRPPEPLTLGDPAAVERTTRLTPAP